MKTLFIIPIKSLLLLLLLSCFLWGQHPYFNYSILDENKIKIYQNNIASTWVSLDENKYGAFWMTDSSVESLVWNHGPWLIGTINDTFKTTLVQWRSDFAPGPLEKGKIIEDDSAGSEKYRVFKIRKGDDAANPDYRDWPADLGAPIDQFGLPKVYADAMTWTVFNALDTTTLNRPLIHRREPENLGQPLEIQQISYQSKKTALENVTFFEWQIINKGNNTIDSSYFGFWTDIDFYFTTRNFPAVDSTLSLAYLWYAHDSTEYWGIAKRAVGYVLLDGPIIKDGERLPITAFHPIGDDTWNGWQRPAEFLADIKYFVKGLDIDGKKIKDPTNQKYTTFPYAGNPETGEGWVWDLPVSGGAGFVFFSGPFTMAPGDSQWIRIALIAAHGIDRFNAIFNLKEQAQYLHELPRDEIITGINRDDKFLPTRFSLSQNYPNPFNPTTTIEYTVGTNNHSPLHVILKIYDVLGREVKTLVNKNQSAGKYRVTFDASGLASGIYYYRIAIHLDRLDAGDFMQTKKMLLLR